MTNLIKLVLLVCSLPTIARSRFWDFVSGAAIVVTAAAVAVETSSARRWYDAEQDFAVRLALTKRVVSALTDKD
jgi:hypothetical protein